MKKIETYMLDEVNDTPKIKDIEECIKIAKEHDCVIELRWFMKWSGKFVRYIHATDDAQDVYDNRIPHVYGM